MNIEELSNVIVGKSSFSLIDYIVVGISLAAVLFYGMYHGILSPTTRHDFLIGGRSMSPGPVAVSSAMLYISALAIIENPADFYYHGIQSFMITIVTVAVVPLSSFIFVSMFHNMELTSVHQYIGHRFNSTAFRCITSFAFIVHETVYVCAILGAVSYALDRYFQVPMMTSVIGIGVFTGINTSLGGFKATVWTQVFYYFWVALFLIALAIVSGSKAGGFLHAFELAAKHGRLELFNLQINPFEPHNLLNFVVGYGFITLMKMTMYQPIVQRYSSIDNWRAAMKSIFMSIPVYILPTLLCLLIGIFLQAAYAGCDPRTFGQIDKLQDIVPYFFNKSLSFIPGIVGFFAATVVGCAICVYSTTISSVTACFYQDFISKCCKSKSKKDSDSPLSCRFISLLYSVLTCVLTLLALKFAYIEKTLPVMISSNMLLFNSILYGPLAAIFLMGMFFPFINKYGASLGFMGGVLLTGYVAIHKMLAANSTPISPLLPIMGDCPDSKGLNGTLLLRILPWHPKDDTVAEAFIQNWPMSDHLLNVSYLLLTLLGALVTIIISLPISIVTGGFCICASRKIPAHLLHPALTFSDCCVDTEQRHVRHAISHRYVDRIASLHNLYAASGGQLDSKPPSYKYSSLPETPRSK